MHPSGIHAQHTLKNSNDPDRSEVLGLVNMMAGQPLPLQCTPPEIAGLIKGFKPIFLAGVR